MKDLPADLRDVYFEFGCAAKTAQLLEVAASNHALAFVSLAFDGSNATNEQRELFQAVVDDANKRTFGNLLKHIRNIGEVSDGIEKIITDALEKKNYLIHKFFRTHNFAINSAEWRKTMRAEIAEVHSALSLAHTVLSGMTHTLCWLLR